MFNSQLRRQYHCFTTIADYCDHAHEDRHVPHIDWASDFTQCVTVHIDSQSDGILGAAYVYIVLFDVALDQQV